MKLLKITDRSQRMKHFQQLNNQSELNLVSMMDIFTILVFFLLVSSSTQQLQAGKDVKLPTSVSSKAPKETLVLTVTKDSVLVQGKLVAKTSQITADAVSIPALENELRAQSARMVLNVAKQDATHEVTIMGDETIPYQLLRKILTSCRNANYSQISFAAYQKSKGKK